MNERSNLHAVDGKKKKKNRESAMSASTLLMNENEAFENELILYVAFISESAVVLVRGDRDRPLFERVTYRSDDGKWIAKIELPKKTAGALFGETKEADTSAMNAGKVRIILHTYDTVGINDS